MKKINISIKRVYAPPDEKDGTRILVDRLWPRGLTRERAKVDLWLKEIAPSTNLRKWFGHEPDKWTGFKERYIRELNINKESVSILKERLKKGPVTLVYGAKDELHNDAVCIKEWLSHSSLEQSLP
ncbi:MAG TPA: DUF488 domain-containing protein [Puia sp.]